MMTTQTSIPHQTPAHRSASMVTYMVWLPEEGRWIRTSRYAYLSLKRKWSKGVTSRYKFATHKENTDGR